jgi:hypothetical protein
MSPRSPHPRTARPQWEDSLLHRPPNVLGPATDQRRHESYAGATPTSSLLFLIAALALRENLLSGGSSFALAIGLVCLILSLSLPLLSRLEQRRRASALDCHHGR